MNLTNPQSKHALELLGENARIALASKVSVLDKIGKISAFAEKVVDITGRAIALGAAVSEVSCNIFQSENVLTLS